MGERMMQTKLRLKIRPGNYKRYTRSSGGNTAMVVFLLAAGLFSVLPLAYSVITAFKPLDEMLVFPPTFFVRRPTLGNFITLPSLVTGLQVPFSRYAFNSFFVAAVTTVLHVLAASMAAFALSKSRLRLMSVLFWIIQFSLMYNGTTLAIPQYLITVRLGIVDTYWAYILPSIPSAVGVFLMKQYIDSGIPDALLEAARIDGAGSFRILWSIVMPLIRPAWLTLALLSFQSQWSMVAGGTILSESLKTLPYCVSQIVNAGIARAGNMAAMGVIMMVPPIVMYWISQCSIMETMSSAGIKE